MQMETDETTNTLTEEQITQLELTPTWNESTLPEFLRRTGTQFSSLHLAQTLSDRGLDNNLLTSLVDNLPVGAYIAGGFISSLFTGEKHESDIDIFFNGPEAFKETLKLFLYPPTEKENNAFAFKGYVLDTNREKIADKETRFVKLSHKKGKRPPIQLMKLVWYESAAHVIDSFDFTVVQFATDGERLVLNPLSVMDAMRKRLVLHRMQFPASTLRRIIKYTHRGFYACPGSLANIAEEIYMHMNQRDGKMDTNDKQYVYLD